MKRKRPQRKGTAPPGSATGLLEDALAHLQGGNPAAAEPLLRQLLEREPYNADGLHLLGLVAYQTRRAEEAEGLIARAIAAGGDDPAFHSNHGAVLNSLRRPADAEAACRRAVALAPDYAEAHNNLGLALELQERPDEAAEIYRRAIALAPGNAQALNNLGNVLRRRDDLDGAVAVYREAVAAAPDFAMAQANLGAALREGGLVDEALAAGRRAVALAPEYAEGHNALGGTLLTAGDAEGALEAFRRAIELEPEYAEAGINLGAALFTLERGLEAEVAYRRVLEDDPDLAEAHNGLGVVLLAIGRLDEAVARFRRAVALAPRYAEALYNLAASRSIEIDDNDIAVLESMVADDAVAVDDRTALHFALAQALDGRGAAERAFHHAAAGNLLRRGRLRDHGHVFDAAGHDRLVDQIARMFDADFFAARRDFGDGSELPVFIVGMPRSGTTLVEQIAASHPAVFGAGERDDIGAIAGPHFPVGTAELDAAAAGDLARAHLERIKGAAGAALRMTDKTPVNFLYLGLIATLFPGARVIHCRRQAPDVCLSCYFQNFAAGLPWATDLDDLGRYYRAYRRIMDHWRRVLPLTVLDVDYEDLVAAPDAGSRRIVDFLGLPWDDACLAFHNSRRTVRSAANWQVRRPVYATSVGRWKAYEPSLGPLLDALDGEE